LGFLHQQQRNRLSNDHASPENNDVRAGDVDVALDEHPLNPERRAGNKAGRITHRELGDVYWMETIDVLRRIKRADDRTFVDLLWRRRLNQNSVDCRIAV